MYFWCICEEEGDLHVFLFWHLEGLLPFYFWLECTYLIRCSLSLLITGLSVQVLFHFLHSTFHKVLHISYFVPMSHLPQLLKHFHYILTLFSEIPFTFLFWQNLGCPLRILPAQKPFLFFFSSVLLPLYLQKGRCPPPYCSLSAYLPSLLPFLKLTSSIYIINYHCDLPATGSFSVHFIIGSLSISHYFLNLAI